MRSTVKYCTRTTARNKSYCHKQITFHSLKNCSPEVYEEVLRKSNFPNYELFDVTDKAYENFIQKVMAVIGNLAPTKNKHDGGASQDWFNDEIVKKITEREKLFKKFKKFCQHVDKDNYQEARNEVQKLDQSRWFTFKAN